MREQLYKDEISKLNDLANRLTHERNEVNESLRSERQKLLSIHEENVKGFELNSASLLSKLR